MTDTSAPSDEVAVGVPPGAQRVGGGSEASEGPEPIAPVLRVVKGDLTAPELAALVAVIAARNAAAAHAAARTKTAQSSQWGNPARVARTLHRVGPGQWSSSALGQG